MTHLMLNVLLVSILAGKAPNTPRTGWVHVYVRDAATKEPMPKGHFDEEVTYWVWDVIPHWFTSRGGGGIVNGRFQLQCQRGQLHKVKISKSDGYCESAFSFKYERGEGVLQDWTAAKAKEGCPSDIKRIEYRIMHWPGTEEWLAEPGSSSLAR